MSMAIIIGAQFNNALLEYYPPLAKHQKHNPGRKPRPSQPNPPPGPPMSVTADGERVL